MNDDAFETHLEAVRQLLTAYKGKGNGLIDSFPSILLFVRQIHNALSMSPPELKSRLLSELDLVTDTVGKLSESLSDGDFEKIKHHYSEIIVLVSAVPKTHER